MSIVDFLPLTLLKVLIIVSSVYLTVLPSPQVHDALEVALCGEIRVCPYYYVAIVRGCMHGFNLIAIHGNESDGKK